MRRTSAFLTLALALSSTSILFSAENAEAKRWGVNARQTRQQNRIYGGVANGNLTQHESRRLERQQAKLAAQEARMRRSGSGLTNAERAKLEAEQNQLSKNIYNQKHDEQQR